MATPTAPSQTPTDGSARQTARRPEDGHEEEDLVPTCWGRWELELRGRGRDRVRDEKTLNSSKT